MKSTQFNCQNKQEGSCFAFSAKTVRKTAALASSAVDLSQDLLYGNDVHYSFWRHSGRLDTMGTVDDVEKVRG